MSESAAIDFNIVISIRRSTSSSARHLLLLFTGLLLASNALADGALLKNCGGDSGTWGKTAMMPAPATVSDADIKDCSPASSRSSEHRNSKQASFKLAC
jgi:hypothetical protein